MIITGIFETAFTFSIRRPAPDGVFPNSKPPFLTLGQDAFISIADIPFSPERIFATSLYSSMEFPKIFAMIFVLYDLKNGR